MINYDLRGCDTFTLRRITGSNGISVIHVRSDGPHNLATRLEAFGPVHIIATKGKTREEIKEELTSRHGKSDTVLLDRYNDFVFPEFLQHVSENILGSLVVINKK